MIIKSKLKKHQFFFKKKVKNANKTFEYSIIWFFIIEKEEKIGIGECNPLLERFFNFNFYEKELLFISSKINAIKKTEIDYYRSYISYSSILFGLEQAFLSLKKKFPILYNSKFTHGKIGLPINSLMWYSSIRNREYEIEKIEKEIFKGFSFIKMKISPIFFHNQYLNFFLQKIQNKYPYIKISMDANGSFKRKEDTISCINKFFDINIIHSIEQPIEAGNWKEISTICKVSKIPIALDEELIGINDLKLKKKLLDTIKPQYIVLKPSICGGFSGCKEWILEADKRKIGWWISSSLESRIGINAIAQWTFKMEQKHKKNSRGVHGLNIGYFCNDFFSPIQIKKGSIWYNSFHKWNKKNFF
ncbi:enolase C-terminal domain-like protein [Blattabacterium cuenoti]|uniref:enolase C-terminal domain-like protein n=1 Tax=Blattabacterium cuenoti TaxID=1653831 RepID=UPI00163B88B3|nr:enolase C-terminal domain-like protein [Blattabacterium cuenoti]